jgi:cell division protease FtsH
MPKADPVHKVSIISRGQAGGYTINLPEEDRHFHSRSEFLDKLVVLLSGYVAEELELGEVTTGASSDLKEATKIAKQLITRFGMSELGPIFLSGDDEWVFLGKELKDNRPYSEQTAARIDQLTQKYIGTALDKARQVLRENREKLLKIAKELIVKETIERDEFEILMANEKPQKPEKPVPSPKRPKIAKKK